MNTNITRVSIIALTVLTLTSLPASVWAKDYQVTGPVIEVTDASITVDKKGEKWEIARTAATKVTGTPKVGDKVTVYYSMTASEIEVKDAKGKAADKAADKAPAKTDKPAVKK